MKVKMLIAAMLIIAFTGGYALSQKNVQASIDPLSFYILKAGGQDTRLDLIVLRYNGVDIPCVVSLVTAREGFVNRAAGSGVSCKWPEDTSTLKP